MKQLKYWGIISFLLLCQFATAQVHIDKGEYFFDSDPGPGKANPITVTTPADSISQNVTVPTTSLSVGFHFLFMRWHNSNGVWGLYEGREFYLLPAGSILNAAHINKAEYFFDTDPGVGNGTAVSVPSTDSSNLNIPISVSSLTVGFHFLFMRYRYDNGVWGMYEGRPFYIIPAGSISNSAHIKSAEYFFDTDPGTGSGTAITVPAATDSSNLSLSISASSLTAGFHTLFIRYRYDNGVWGLYEGRPFYVIPPLSNNTAHISSAEYFFDNDPGAGNGIAITIPSAADSVSLAVNLPVASLSPGFHYLFVRFRYDNGTWGLYEGRTFYIIPPGTLPNPAHINSAEYFFDTDPGVGKATAIVVSPAADSVAQALNNISVTGLSTGSHNLFIRYRYDNGIWGLYEGRPFTICTPPVVNVTVTGDTTFCSGTDSVKLTANAGSRLTYQWERNGTTITGATAQSYTVRDSSGSYRVVVDSGTCYANSITTLVTINPVTPAAVNISANPGNTICDGTPVTFTATPVNGGTLPLYQWKLNGNNVSTGSSYTTDTLKNNNVITCVMTSNAPCATGSLTATSNNITMSVAGKAIAGTVTATKNIVCDSTAAHLTDNGSSGGNIQWQSSADSITGFTGITGATAAAYTSGSITQTIFFRVVVANNSCSDTSGSLGIRTVANPVAIFASSTNGHVVSFNGGASIGAVSYSWNFGDDSTSALVNPVHTYGSVNTYHVCLAVENNNNCTNTVCRNVSAFPTGVNGISNDGTWQVYPDPFSNQLYIGTGQATDKIQSIEVYDLLGRMVFYRSAKDITETPVKLDMSGLNSGVYCLRIKTRNGEYIKSVVKQQ